MAETELTGPDASSRSSVSGGSGRNSGVAGSTPIGVGSGYSPVFGSGDGFWS